jgi:hypothetical protein
VSNEKETCEHPRQWIIPNTVAGNSGWCFECGSINLTGEWKQPDAILRLKDEARGAQQGYERQLTKAGVWAAKAGLIQGKLDKAEREAQRLRTALERAEPTLRLAHAAMHMVRGYSEQGRVIDPASMGVTIDALLDASEVARTALEASEVKP